jgi:hypothetical protein
MFGQHEQVHQDDDIKMMTSGQFRKINSGVNNGRNLISQLTNEILAINN